MFLINLLHSQQGKASVNVAIRGMPSCGIVATDSLLVHTKQSPSHLPSAPSPPVHPVSLPLPSPLPNCPQPFAAYPGGMTASPDVRSASLLRSTRIWPPEAPPCQSSRAQRITGLAYSQHKRKNDEEGNYLTTNTSPPSTQRGVRQGSRDPRISMKLFLW